MADSTTQIIAGVITGLLSGGTSAVTTFLTVFRDIKKKITSLEEKVGDSELKTGIYNILAVFEEHLKKIRREMDLWEDDPPPWAKRMVARSKYQSADDLVFEESTARAMKDVRDRFKRLEEELETFANRLKDQGDWVSRSEYSEDSKARAEEMAKVREQLAMANGLLRGVMTTMGYINAEPEPKPKEQ